MTEKPLIDKRFRLKKMKGKGGWTYAEIPKVLENKNTPFGWVKVKGWIDDYEIKQLKLMPMRNGNLFLSVNAKIRKKIKKEAGAFVKVVLFPDNSKFEIPEEIRDCFAQEPTEVWKNFLSFSEGEQKAYIDWIYQAKKSETQANLILNMMDRVSNKLRIQDKET